MRQIIELYFSVILQKNRDCAKYMSGEAALAGSSSRYLKSDEDENPRDAAYLDQAPEFPSYTYSIVSFETMGFKTVKNPGGQVVRAQLHVPVTFRLQE